MTQMEYRALAVKRAAKTFKTILTRYNNERAAGRYYRVRASAVDRWEKTLIVAARSAWSMALADEKLAATVETGVDERGSFARVSFSRKATSERIAKAAVARRDDERELDASAPLRPAADWATAKALYASRLWAMLPVETCSTCEQRFKVEVVAQAQCRDCMSVAGTGPYAPAADLAESLRRCTGATSVTVTDEHPTDSLRWSSPMTSGTSWTFTATATMRDGSSRTAMLYASGASHVECLESARAQARELPAFKGATVINIR